jgi:hypothetical protein
MITVNVFIWLMWSSWLRLNNPQIWGKVVRLNFSGSKVVLFIRSKLSIRFFVEFFCWVFFNFQEIKSVKKFWSLVLNGNLVRWSNELLCSTRCALLQGLFKFKCKQGLFGILEARLLTSQVRRLTGGSAQALPTGNLLTRELSTVRANKMTKKPCYILNVNSPVGKSHLVVHMCFFVRPNI